MVLVYIFNQCNKSKFIGAQFYNVINKEIIQGGGDMVSVHFTVTLIWTAEELVFA